MQGSDLSGKHGSMDIVPAGVVDRIALAVHRSPSTVGLTSRRRSRDHCSMGSGVATVPETVHHERCCRSMSAAVHPVLVELIYYFVLSPIQQGREPTLR